MVVPGAVEARHESSLRAPDPSWTARERLQRATRRAFACRDAGLRPVAVRAKASAPQKRRMSGYDDGRLVEG